MFDSAAVASLLSALLLLTVAGAAEELAPLDAQASGDLLDCTPVADAQELQTLADRGNSSQLVVCLTGRQDGCGLPVFCGVMRESAARLQTLQHSQLRCIVLATSPAHEELQG